jgi:hypothetical protein
MQVRGVNRIFRRLAATTGLLLILVATTAGADPLEGDAANAAASQPLHSDVSAREVDAPVSASSVVASTDSVSTVEKPVGQADDIGAFLGQLVTRYLDRFN